MGALEKVMAKQAATPVARLGASAEPKRYAGGAAIAQVEKSLGRPLTLAERRVVVEEGFVGGEYLDTKGIRTGGVGQTGEWLDKGFDETFKHHVDRVRKRVPKFDSMPEALQAELIQSEYRGDLGLSPTAMKHLNANRYQEAGDEFLNNDEYRNPKTSSGITARMKATADAMRSYRP